MLVDKKVSGGRRKKGLQIQQNFEMVVLVRLC